MGHDPAHRPPPPHPLSPVATLSNHSCARSAARPASTTTGGLSLHQQLLRPASRQVAGDAPQEPKRWSNASPPPCAARREVARALHITRARHRRRDPSLHRPRPPPRRGCNSRRHQAHGPRHGGTALGHSDRRNGPRRRHLVELDRAHHAFLGDRPRHGGGTPQRRPPRRRFCC